MNMGNSSAQGLVWQRVQDSLDRQAMMCHPEARLLRVEPDLTTAPDGTANPCAEMQQTLVPVPKTY